MGRRTATIAVALVVLAAGTACGSRRAQAKIPDPVSVSVDVESLWKQEAAEDPITAYKVRLSAEPDNAALHNNLGNAYVHENHMKLAISEFKKAARLDRASPVPWNNLGTTYKKIGRRVAAKEAFERALKIDDRYALGWYNLGTLYDEIGDYDRAIDLYLKALALKPELADVRFNPQVVENRHLMVVRLRHFLEEAGNIALPLDRLPE